MDDEQTLQELEELLDELAEENRSTPVIVEGDKDINALRKLGLTGEIIRFNKGQSVSNFCDLIAQKYRKIILLTDWDWRGGRLGTSIRKHLENRAECDMTYRQSFAKRCMCRTVEGIPRWIETLRTKVKNG
ncbi:MAG: topoisomerase [Candidatus Thermoplasmatota archaeon]|nr:topoisomerase [Candidatus Thermoplasmatota archaeon]